MPFTGDSLVRWSMIAMRALLVGCVVELVCVLLPANPTLGLVPCCVGLVLHILRVGNNFEALNSSFNPFYSSNV